MQTVLLILYYTNAVDGTPWFYCCVCPQRTAVNNRQCRTGPRIDLWGVRAAGRMMTTPWPQLPRKEGCERKLCCQTLSESVRRELLLGGWRGQKSSYFHPPRRSCYKHSFSTLTFSSSCFSISSYSFLEYLSLLFPTLLPWIIRSPLTAHHCGVY